MGKKRNAAQDVDEKKLETYMEGLPRLPLHNLNQQWRSLIETIAPPADDPSFPYLDNLPTASGTKDAIPQYF